MIVVEEMGISRSEIYVTASKEFLEKHIDDRVTESLNPSRIQTVIVIALSSNLRLAEAPGNVKLPARKSGLPKESVANVSQFTTLDKDFLKEKAGKVDRTTLYQIEQGIRLILSLP